MDIWTQLIRDEGIRLTPYYDSVGIATVGVGHRLDKPFSQPAMMQQLRDDIDEAARDCENFPFWPRLSAARQGVLINMRFNLGWSGLKAFRKMLAAIDENDFSRAAAEMLDSTWAEQTGDRAIRLARQMREDAWQ